MNGSEGRPASSPGDDPRVWFQTPRQQGREQEQEPYVEFQAQVSGSARVFQAARDLYAAERDLHVHYTDRVRAARRATAGARLDDCPYPGLSAFGPEQSAWFFGRDTATAELLLRLDERLRTGGPVAVVAPSGAGKSSLAVQLWDLSAPARPKRPTTSPLQDAASPVAFSPEEDIMIAGCSPDGDDYSLP